MDYKLKVEPRTQKASAVRASGSIPGVVYGPELEAQSITLPKKGFLDLLDQAGETTLIDCSITGVDKPVAVLIADVQRDPVRDEVHHVDLRQVNMSEKIDADIALVYEGEAPAIKAEGGMLLTNADVISVRCLPRELVSEIVVSVESLATFEDTISISDVKVPEGYEVLSNASDVIAKVVPQRSEEEMAALDEEVTEDVDGVAKEGETQEQEGEKTTEDEKPQTEESKE